eukprot:9496244-Pyramimonas_sp.AAC.2
MLRGPAPSKPGAVSQGGLRRSSLASSCASSQRSGGRAGPPGASGLSRAAVRRGGGGSGARLLHGAAAARSERGAPRCPERASFFSGAARAWARSASLSHARPAAPAWRPWLGARIAQRRPPAARPTGLDW